jgi:PAB-dependent poly(A)-specific ribonuclease subunit 3
MYLLSKPTPLKNIDDVITMIGPRILDEVIGVHRYFIYIYMISYTDFLEGELMKELENSRLVRLLSKLGFINERPEFDMDPRWSETGDRYLLKLMRDYVFHQVDEIGNPIIDLGHVVETLNKVYIYILIFSLMQG